MDDLIKKILDENKKIIEAKENGFIGEIVDKNIGSEVVNKTGEEIEIIGEQIVNVAKEAFDKLSGLNGKSDNHKKQNNNKIFDFSSMNKEKFSTGNTKVGNLVNSLKDKGIITSELMENEETLGLVKGLLRDIHKDLVKGKDLEGLLNTNLNTDEFGENIDVGIAKFISKNSPNTSQKNFEQIAGNVIKPLSNNGMIEAKSMYKSLKNERKARLEIEKKLQIIL